ncbi:MAG TPA: glutathione S-transferase family protein [Burkholderiales bacterium]|jgi:glutathione S-transferase|nr:glutathione S-transferase family protein [Burkholderiales bacterium]
MTEIILHHYPQSPVSEKVRVALGIKRLAWRSVEIPRLPPKPYVMPLTGGYRRTPVMQIGADIYCDSQCILRELQRRFPVPTFFPGGADGIPWGLNRWADGLFDLAVRLSLGANADQLPEAFATDRVRLFIGPDGDLQKLKADLPHIAAQLRAQFGWLDQRFATGRRFILGGQPGLPDAIGYYLVWFVRARWQGGPALFAEFPALEAWEQRVKAIGHGNPAPMSPAEAVEIARSNEPATPEQGDPIDPQTLELGARVSVVPDLNSGEAPVHGTVRLVDRDRIAILRENPRVGTVCVHFPRVGYRVAAE